MNKLLKSVLKTVVYLLDQAEDVADDVRDRVSDGVDRVSDRARDFYPSEDHTVRNVLTFVAGVGVGVGAAMLFAPASGEELRGQIGDKVQDISDRVRDKFSAATSETRRSATGTEGV